MCLFLKRLELQGFKSFADKTVLEFADGATGVVGPNGSGKSNISDAIRWVIGEMSAKSLRGSNMQDVIFAGTETRKPVNFAEVSLVLDNSTHLFNIDYEEITVTRRLFRSGESVYQINRANCRLKDIHELFMDTGLGRDGYSIIGQGSVSQILSTKAEDRRSIFEEAAGVSKYKYKREEAERKLAGTEENLVRINDIVHELEGQIEPLRKQSEKARKYMELYAEFKALDVNLSLIALERNKHEAQKADKLYESVSGEIDELNKKESKAGEKISSLYEKQKHMDEEKTKLHSELIDNESRGAEIEKDISIAKNNIKNNSEMTVRIENEINLLNKKSRERIIEIKELENEIKEKTAESERIMSDFNTMQNESSEIIKRQEKLHEDIEKKKEEAADKLAEASSRKERMSGVEKLRANFFDRKRVLQAEIKSFNEGVEDTKKEIEDNIRKIAQKREKREKLIKIVEQHNEKENFLKQKIADINRQGNDLNVEYNTKASKKRMLEGMENDYAGYAKSVKAVLKADSIKNLSIYGTLSGLVDVKREYIVAIETALGGALQNIIVESEADAKAAIEFLRRTRAGRATFLPVSSVHGRILESAAQVKDCKGFVGIASELVRCDKKYDGIIKSLLGRVAVFDNIDNAIAVSRHFGYKFRVVTLEGDILNAGGSMSGGSVNKQSGLISRAAEIKELGKDIAKLTQALRELKEERETSINELNSVKKQLETYEPVIREYEDEILRLENTCQHLQTVLESGGSTEENYKNEIEQIDKQLNITSEETSQLLIEIRRLENETAEIQNSIESMSAEYTDISSKRDEKSQAIMDETMRLAEIRKDLQIGNEKIEAAKAENEAAVKETDEKLKYKQTLLDRNDELSKNIEEYEKDSEKIKIISEQLRDKIRLTDEQKEGIVDSLKRIQEENKDLTDKLIQLQQELARVDTRRVKLNSESDTILNRLWDNYELTYSAAAEMRTETENEKEASKRASELKGQIKSLGHVNMDSIDEYREKKERFEFMNTQKKDLEKSKDNLRKIISSMEELMEEHFGNQFNIISESFSQVFTELFGGGKGRLYLSDPSNLLESGIEIEVQLPGKGLQNINLYSGGEKSFIAIALLFAILKVKPTPFCILDEIDAALDDINVSRFATYLKNYTDQTQFIVITHRRGTMEAVNRLYGVTMQEKGVTKTLSLNIDEVDDDMVS